jgi:hypothetical protein
MPSSIMKCAVSCIPPPEICAPVLMLDFSLEIEIYNALPDVQCLTLQTNLRQLLILVSAD